ncbi:cysteine protease [Coniothyrium glycines]
MADKVTELQACKAAASTYRAQLQTAANKDEALTLAIAAAENLMKAMKLSSDALERRELKAQCGEIMNAADRIKSDAQWVPAARPQQQPSITRDEHIGKWAATVASSGRPETLVEDTISQASSSRQALSSVTAPVEHIQILTDSTNQNRHAADAASPHDLDVDSFVEAPTPIPQLPLQPAHMGTSSPSITPSAAPYTHIRRLAEPVSSRKRSKKEEIILLKASMVNGFKCPPWDKSPSTSEFVSQEGAGPFVDAHDLSLSAYQQQFFQGWVRAANAMPPPSMHPNSRDGIGPLMSSTRPIDLVQDAASDCSVVASLCAGIARAERGHDEMLSNKLFPYDKQLGRPVPSTNGKYIVRLNFNGCWRKVVIDDRLPVSKTHRLLHVLDRRNPALLWPTLLEKAYLKVRGGYDFPGSNSCSDLWTLTGWVPEQVFLQETDTIPDQLWNRIYNAFTYGDVLVTVGTGKMSSRQERELGLEGQHSYVVLDMKETDHDRLLLVKNPWVEGKGWRGPRPTAVTALDAPTSSGGTNHNPETHHRDSMPTPERPHPTTFWIGLEHVIQHFESLYLNWNPGLFRYRQDIHFEWNLEAQSPGGCIVNNPQFAFTSRSSGPVWFLLSRHFRDSQSNTKEDSDTFNDGSILLESQMNVSGEAPKGYMSIYVCSGKGERLFMKDTYLESSDYVSTPQCLLRWNAELNTTYTVVVDQDDLPLSPYTFSLSAFSNSAITLEPASPRYPFQKLEAGAWTRQTAGGGTGSSKYFENPQYSLEVHQRGPLAMLLTSTNHDHPLHVKLALGYGKRIYRLQSRDVLTDSGNHRSNCVFAETADLQPGLYTIICSLFEPGQTGAYTLRIDSTAPVALKPIPRDGAGLLSMKLGPACFAAAMHKVAAPLLPHRLASYTIVARFLKATSPRSMDLGQLARSPLRLSVEIGRGPERKFVIASERGEYADSATVRSESVNIDPTVCQQGDLWLVLDRLSGPGGPVEEWYDVEIFTDVPQACSVGVWREWND